MKIRTSVKAGTDHLGRLTGSDSEEVIAMKIRTSVKAGADHLGQTNGSLTRGR